MSEELSLAELSEPLLSYADFLISLINKENIIRVNKQGVLIPDYFPVFDPILNHTSLNHGLGGLNLLLEAYLTTNNEKYLKGALDIHEGIAGLGEQWIREDGDTWYKVNTDLTFVGRDYEILTVEDLLKSHQLWSKINPTLLPIYETLLQSKTSYLKDVGFSIPKDVQQQINSLDIEN